MALAVTYHRCKRIFV